MLGPAVSSEYDNNYNMLLFIIFRQTANKPGECPSPDRALSQSCSRLVACRGDSDCRGDRKCCYSNRCGGVCTEPESEAVTEGEL